MEPTTCGQGIAENSGLPAKLAELIAAIGAVLEHHTKALDPADPESRPEFDAYIDLMQQHREVSDQLSRLAERMAGYNDLPMARHDVAELGNSKAIAVFFGADPPGRHSRRVAPATTEQSPLDVEDDD
jgi:hypothetical protein